MSAYASVCGGVAKRSIQYRVCLCVTSSILGGRTEEDPSSGVQACRQVSQDTAVPHSWGSRPHLALRLRVLLVR
jgi:hypothetical protein